MDKQEIAKNIRQKIEEINILAEKLTQMNSTILLEINRFGRNRFGVTIIEEII